MLPDYKTQRDQRPQDFSVHDPWMGSAVLMAVSWFPLSIDPVLMRMGPLEVRWYGLMYVFATICAAFILRSELRRKPGHLSEALWPELLFYGMVAAVVGGRLGHVIIYDADYFLKHLGEVFWGSWHGMSFHGGLIGVVIAALLYARIRRVPFLELLDIAALATPIGIMLVRIGNLINGELYGRATTVPWAVVSPWEEIYHGTLLSSTKLFSKVLFYLRWCGGSGSELREKVTYLLYSSSDMARSGS